MQRKRARPLFTVAARIHSVSPGEGGRNAGGRGRRLSSNRDFLFLVNLSSSRPRKAPASPYFRIDFARFAILPAPKSFMTIVMSHNATVEYPISMSRCAQKSLQTVSTPLATAINSLDMRWHTTPPIPNVAPGAAAKAGRAIWLLLKYKTTANKKLADRERDELREMS